MTTTEMHPCPSCGEERVADSRNECADCYLALQIANGRLTPRDVRTSVRPPSRIDGILARVERLGQR